MGIGSRFRVFCPSRRFVVRAGLATVAIFAAGAWTYAVVAGSVTAGSGVDQAALAQCMSQQKGNCEAQVTGLAECMSQEQVCNRAAQDNRITGYGPLQSPSSTRMTQDDATSRALLLSADASKVTLVLASEMPLSSYVALSGLDQAEFGTVSPARLVWAVTVHAPIWTDAAPFHPPYLKQAYTVVFDAATYTGMEVCIGCATLG